MSGLHWANQCPYGHHSHSINLTIDVEILTVYIPNQ